MIIQFGSCLLVSAFMLATSSTAIGQTDTLGTQRNITASSSGGGITIVMASSQEQAHDHGENHGHHHTEENRHHHDKQQVIRLSTADIAEFDIGLGTAKSKSLSSSIHLNGEVLLDQNRVAHVVPRVTGNVRNVFAGLGSRVSQGDVLVTIESQQLADAKAGYVAARERAQLAESNFDRFRLLWEERISSEQEYLETRNASREADIKLTAAEQKLIALDVTLQDLNNISSGNGQGLTHLKLKAPIGGEVIERHATRGEFIGPETTLFIIADISNVWIDVTVYEDQLPHIRRGQEVTVYNSGNTYSAVGTISYVSPIVDLNTRTATARTILDNAAGSWKPGTFINAVIRSDSIRVGIAIPKDAVQSIDGKQIVFIRTAEGFEPMLVQTGRADDKNVEIVSGLDIGQSFVARNAFLLKSEIGRAGLEHAGHAH